MWFRHVEKPWVCSERPKRWLQACRGSIWDVVVENGLRACIGVRSQNSRTAMPMWCVVGATGRCSRVVGLAAAAQSKTGGA